MRRREFLAVAGSTLIWPGTAFAQRPLATVGFLNAFVQSPAGPTEPFLQGLREAGFVDGRNVTVVSRGANGSYVQLKALADELVSLNVSVIAAWGLPAALAAKGATATLPIVFWTAGDPVADGLIASLSRPGGNLTGVVFLNNALGAKRLELLRQLMPDATAFAVLINPNAPSAEPQLKDAQAAARALGVQLHVVSAQAESEIDAAFATLAGQRAEALLVTSDAYLRTQSERIIALAAQYAIPTVYTVRAYCQAGGLISYASGDSMLEEFGRYTGRVLKGEKPADMPVQQSTKFDLVINLKTAKSLGLTVPPSLLTQANEVIE